MIGSTPLLDKVRTPADLRRLPESDLRQLADELRSETISAVSVTGGHLGAGLGVVELTVALHYVFDTPKDRIIWDVGHQAYPHKILTGRRDRIRTLRQGGGLSGFTKRAESVYDPFGAAHSSTSISAGLGMAVARDLAGENNSVVAVIGDGSMSAGMAYEAMNNAGALHKRLIVILNDNDMSIAPPVGGMSAYLARLGLGRHLPDAARLRQATGPAPAALLLREGEADRGICARLLHRRHPVRGTRLLLRRADRRPQSRAPAARSQERPRQRGRSGPGPCRHPEGQRLRAGRSLGRQVSRRQQVRRDHRHAGEAEGQRAGLYARLRRQPRQGSREGRQDRRHHGRHAVGHRPRRVRQDLPEAHLRRRHRRAARRHLRGGLGDRRLQAVLRHLLDLPAAWLRPGRSRRGAAEPAGALRARPRWSRRRRRPDSRRLLRRRLSRLPAQHDDHGGGGRGGTRPHGRDAGRL